MLHPSHRRYVPLPDPQSQEDYKSWTRIMVLQPGASNSPLVVTLSIEHIQTCEPYEALSYVWGQEKALDRLIRDGAPTQITKNLDVALRSIRLPDKSRRLWVDAICINQQDLDERGSQVKMMRRIYQQAACVIVWLGPSSPGIEDAFYLASQLAELRNAMGLRDPRDGERRSSLGEMGRALVNDYIDPELPAWKHLTELFQREWWNRSWCVQEVVASSNSSARCDDLEISMRDLLSASAFIRQRREHIFSGSVLEFWDFVFQSKFQLQPNSATSGSVGGFLHLLASTRDFKATDPRDKIYAFYGITDEGVATDHARGRDVEHNNVETHQTIGGTISSLLSGVKSFLGSIVKHDLDPDYHKSIAHVYRDAALFILGRNRHSMLDLLSHVHHSRDVDDPLHGQCPTWVPRWFEPQSSTPLGCNSWFAAGVVNAAKAGLQDMKHRQQSQPTFQASSFNRPNIDVMKYRQRNHPIFEPPGFKFPNRDVMQYSHLVHSGQLPSRNNRDVLVRHGFRIDRVAKVTKVIKADIEDQLTVGTLWEELFGTKLESVEARSSRYTDGTPLLSAFGVTLSACGYDRKKPSRNQWQQMIVPVQTDFEAFMIAVYSNIKESSVSIPLTSPGPSLGNASRFEELAKTVCYNRRLYFTESGYLGLGPKFVQPGDVICVLVGGKIPFALRNKADCWALVGEAYLHDISILSGVTANETMEQKGIIGMETFSII